ncbi:MAG: hypothetical protein MJK08_03455 [Campylobacterales bacterium]|nr:hypothetical protein [Campylobacterales bacterium]NQY21478.1 hypothetical protein [Campylobacteraceae bacterium]NQY52430.1 hypothetical protein [Campylobacteraceae bacterium]
MQKSAKFEILIYIMFISGFLLWQDLDLSWEFFRLNQFIHVFISITIIFFLSLYLYSHIQEHKNTIIKRKKTYKKRKQVFLGILIMLTLIILLVSGTYLFLWGNRGGDTYGIISNFLHFYLSFFFVYLIIYHSYYLGRNGLKKDKNKIKQVINKEEKNLC